MESIWKRGHNLKCAWANLWAFKDNPDLSPPLLPGPCRLRFVIGSRVQKIEPCHFPMASHRRALALFCVAFKAKMQKFQRSNLSDFEIWVAKQKKKKKSFITNGTIFHFSFLLSQRYSEQNIEHLPYVTPKPWTGREISGRLGGDVQFNARQL